MMDYDYDAAGLRESDAQIDGYERERRACERGSCPGCSRCAPKKEASRCPRCGERLIRRGGSYGYPGSLECPSAGIARQGCTNERKEGE